jgi:hypothetical protein
MDLYCFVEYGVDVSIDILTGSRVWCDYIMGFLK